MTDKPMSRCAMCKHEWPTGTDGDHSCLAEMHETIKQLEENSPLYLIDAGGQVTRLITSGEVDSVLVAVVELIKIRQSGCSNLCVENTAPGLFRAMLDQLSASKQLQPIHHHELSDQEKSELAERREP